MRGVRRRLLVLLAAIVVPASAHAATSPWPTAITEESPPQVSLTIVIAGNAGGTVWQPGGKLNCDAFGGVCTASVPVGRVFLMEQPELRATFVGWSGGGCSGTSSCTTELQADTSVTAMFEPEPIASSECAASSNSETTPPPRPVRPARKPSRRIQRLKCGRGTRRQELPSGAAECVRIERHPRR